MKKKCYSKLAITTDSIKQTLRYFRSKPCQSFKDKTLLENTWPNLLMYFNLFSFIMLFKFIVRLNSGQLFNDSIHQIYFFLLPYICDKLIIKRIKNKRIKIWLICLVIFAQQNFFLCFIILVKPEFINGQKPESLMTVTVLNLLLYQSQRFILLQLINFFLQIFMSIFQKIYDPFLFFLYMILFFFVITEREYLFLKMSLLINFQKESLQHLPNGIGVIQPNLKKLLFRNQKFENLINQSFAVELIDQVKKTERNESQIHTKRQQSLFLDQNFEKKYYYDKLLTFFSNIEIETDEHNQNQDNDQINNCNIEEKGKSMLNIFEEILQSKTKETVYNFKAFYHNSELISPANIGIINKNLSVFEIIINTDLNYQSEKCFMIAIYDITTSITSDYLQKMNDFKSKILKSISHELRTRLNVVQGILEMLQQKSLSLEITSLISSAFNNCRIQSQIIGSIVDYNLFQENQLNKKMGTEDISYIVKDVISFFQQEADLKNIKIIFDCESLQQFTVATDIERLYQILVNIISNAIKFTFFMGLIHITITNEYHFPKKKKQSRSKSKLLSKHLFSPAKIFDDKEFENQKQIFHITVKDTGIGISKNKLQQIRKALEDDNFIVSSFSDEATGFMLGLRSANILLKSLNESSGDWLQIFSEQNIGTTVSLTVFNHQLPSFVGQEGKINQLYKLITKKPSSNMILCTCPEEILIADDEPFNLIVLESILKSLNKKVIKANNGQECVNIFIERASQCSNMKCTLFEVIFMDYQMPILNGKEAAIQILKYCQYQMRLEVPIIGCTAFSANSDLQELKLAGMKEILLKPVTFNSLKNLFLRLKQKKKKNMNE